MALGLLVMSYRYALSAPSSPQWLTKLPTPPWGEFFLFAGLLATTCLLIYSVFLQSMFIPSASMEPGLKTGKTILIKPNAFGLINPFTGSHLGKGEFSGLERGEIVIAKFAYNADVRYIKRVIGLAGDSIKIDRTGITLNEKHLPFLATDEADIYRIKVGKHSYVVKIETSRKFVEQSEIIIPDGHVFLLGDNLTKSSDSRDLGPIPIHNLIATLY